ncbi:MAG: alpha-mannosidase [Clostridia bacterium]|nr:alpha-mannosidase [Clostridia bacterium]
MNQQAYINRTYKKFDNVLELYAKKIFHVIGRADAVSAYETDEHLRLPPDANQTKPIAPDTTWGHEWGNLWLTASYTVPACADGKTLCVLCDAEAVEILCFCNGKPAGIINSKNRFLGGEHSAMFLASPAKAGETYSLAFECYAGHTCLGCSPYENYDRDESLHDACIHTYHGIFFAVMDTLMRDFVFDLSTVLQIARLPGENFTAMRAHECLMKAFPYLIGDVASASEEELHASCETIRSILAPALEKKEGGDRSRGKIGVIGHSHMDTAWLWPVSETIRKCARTYSQTLNLMDMYPEYTFIQSSALHLDWMRQYYPDIFEGIKEKVAEGRYEPNGGVWVECDCNITGGEAMVRQFLYGQRFTKQYLNYTSDAFWLPDTFGYNGAIPQIMQGADVKYFYTTKMAWSDLNLFPADTFVWRGIDGTEVTTHLNRMHLIPDVQTLSGTVTEIRDKHSNDHRLAAYGYGDGGGGPTYGMLEYLKRTKDLCGMPEIVPTTVSAFMDEIEARKDQLPVYDGELYLEYHRGTLTQMHEVKKNNRLAEFALADLELFNVLADEKTHPKHDDWYKILLKNQFHDILPGTSIPRVYEVAIPEMHSLIDHACTAVKEYANKLSVPAENTVSVYNPLSFARDDAIVLDGAYGVEGETAQVYKDMDGNEKTAVLLHHAIPAMEAAVLKLQAPASPSASVFRAEGNVLVTPVYRVTFDENGYISSLIDRRTEREIANRRGAALGTLWFGEDMPTAYDNWEVEDDIFLKLKPVTKRISHAVVSDGAAAYRIRSVYAFGRTSTATVDTVFYANSARIDYEVKLDWQERHALMKAGFDVNIRSGFMKNEIQFGHVDRPTTSNHSIEAARFEVCNHKWTDLSETRYGVAILNDCKYGISCKGSDMRLTLHRGGCRPDFVTDFGIHTMTYSLLPHIGAFQAETVVLPSYMLNRKPILVNGILHAPKLFDITAPNILCEAVKPAEDVEHAYVLRLYECERSTTNCTLNIYDAKHVYVTNLLEEKKEELQIVDGSVFLPFRPFEIKTILIER